MHPVWVSSVVESDTKLQRNYLRLGNDKEEEDEENLWGLYMFFFVLSINEIGDTP